MTEQTRRILLEAIFLQNKVPAMRIAIYARYSSNNQREASIEDQIRSCSIKLESMGFSNYTPFTDYTISGASLNRPGIQALIQECLSGKFDLVIAEALDRLSRDQEDIAALYKRFSFAGVKLLTVSEGEIDELYVGLKGTMNSLFLKDLADKTRRGLRGRVEAGKSGGGKCYGYDVVTKQNASGDLIRGERTINAVQAQIVRRIFEQYGRGKSPRAIAQALNKEGISGPNSRSWGPSTINGNRARGTGILNNELYIGCLVWNRLRYIKDPSTGKRISRLNPEKEWIIKEVPDLQIIPDDLWQAVKDHQDRVTKVRGAKQPKPFWQSQRPKYLLSGLMRCGSCGGGYSKINKNLFGCSTSRNKGTCDNRLNIRREVIENTVLDGLRHHLMAPDLFAIFCEEFIKELNKLRRVETEAKAAKQKQLVKVTADIAKLIEAIRAHRVLSHSRCAL
ncbi:recombinase family protein [Flexibacterium corallicola]|uniref:recombinase family protein n=1 Tax=Flexibacterium corallicola TaxID=3037259 RepID=UPI00286F457D|nr:recombinase family protein [Pseudovibrio sp. M1P-2-3]